MLQAIKHNWNAVVTDFIQEPSSLEQLCVHGSDEII